METQDTSGETRQTVGVHNYSIVETRQAAGGYRYAVGLQTYSRGKTDSWRIQVETKQAVGGYKYM